MSETYKTLRTSVLQRLGLTKPETQLSGDPEMPVWMDPIEFAQLTAVVAAIAPTRIVEWGSGGSTLAWLSLVPNLEVVVSVEHHAPWHDRVKEVIQDPRIRLGLCPPDASAPEPHFPPRNEEESATYDAWCKRCESEPAILADYLAYPSAVAPEVTFDLALVDGRARTLCATEAMRILRPGGVLLLHDAQRAQYHETLAKLGEPVYLDPWVQGQLCILRKPT